MNKALVDNKYDTDVFVKLNNLKRMGGHHRSIYNFRIAKKIYFKDMLWDFSYQNKNNRVRVQYLFDFNYIPEPFVFYVKTTILNELIIKKNSMGGTKKNYNSLKTISRELMMNRVFDIRLLDKEKVKILIEKKMETCKLNYIEKLGISFKKMISIIQEVEGYDMQDVLEYLNEICSFCFENRSSSAVNQYIPNEFLNQIVSLALRDIDDTNLKMDYRIIACLIVIIAETGMRAEEVSLLEANKLDHIRVNNKEFGYLRFLTFKTHKYRTEGKETYTWLSDKALKAYTICEKLSNEIIDNLSEISKLRLLIYLDTNEEFNRKVSIVNYIIKLAKNYNLKIHRFVHFFSIIFQKRQEKYYEKRCFKSNKAIERGC